MKNLLSNEVLVEESNRLSDVVSCYNNSWCKDVVIILKALSDRVKDQADELEAYRDSRNSERLFYESRIASLEPEEREWGY